MALSAGVRCDCNPFQWEKRCPHDGGILRRRELGSDREIGAVQNLLTRIGPIGAPALPVLRRRVLSRRDVSVEDLPRLRSEVQEMKKWLEKNPGFDLPREDSTLRFTWVNEGRPALDRFLTSLQGLVSEAVVLKKAIHFSG